MAQAGTKFPKVRRILLFDAPVIFLTHFWPASTLLHGHIALAIPSLPETDPQILENWRTQMRITWANKSFQAMDFGLECQHDLRGFCELNTSYWFPYVV